MTNLIISIGIFAVCIGGIAFLILKGGADE